MKGSEMALRRHSRQRWQAGRKNANLSEPTIEEIKIFYTGFNMGWEAHKTKRYKEVPETNLIKRSE